LLIELGNRSFRKFSISSRDETLSFSSLKFQEEIERIEAEAERFRIELMCNYEKQLEKEKKQMKMVKQLNLKRLSFLIIS
jgi:hypothetical protein